MFSYSFKCLKLNLCTLKTRSESIWQTLLISFKINFNQNILNSNLKLLITKQ